MNLGAIMDVVQAELEDVAMEKMKAHALPPSLMVKIINGVQIRIQQETSREYAENLVALEIEAMKKSDTEEHTGTKEELMEALKKGGVKDEGICSKN
jgi:hypothetical protein